MSKNEDIRKTKLLMQQRLSHGAPSPKLSKMLEILVDHFSMFSFEIMIGSLCYFSAVFLQLNISMILFYGCRSERSKDITGHYFLKFQRKRKVCIIVVCVPLFTCSSYFFVCIHLITLIFRDIMNALSNIGDVVKATEFIGQSSGLLL